MRTEIIMMATIKNRTAKVGDLFFYKGKYEAYLDAITVGQEGYCLQVTVHKDKDLMMTNIYKDDLESEFFWEKPIIYQLPDTDGNLSEVKVGQLVWCKRHNENPLSCKIIGFDKSDIVIESQQHTKKVFNVHNISGLGLAVNVTTNKP